MLCENKNTIEIINAPGQPVDGLPVVTGGGGGAVVTGGGGVAVVTGGGGVAVVTGGGGGGVVAGEPVHKSIYE